MKKNKIIIIVITTFLIFDILNYLFFNIGKEYSDFSEAFNETSQTTYIKWFLYFLALLDLFFLEKQKVVSYLLCITSIGMLWLSITEGPLNHLLLWYSSISLSLLGIIGVYLFYLGVREIIKNRRGNGSN